MLAGRLAGWLARWGVEVAFELTRTSIKSLEPRFLKVGRLVCWLAGVLRYHPTQGQYKAFGVSIPQRWEAGWLAAWLAGWPGR